MSIKSKLRIEDIDKRGNQDAPYFSKYQNRNQTHMYKQPNNYYLSNAQSNKNSEDYYNNFARHQSYQVTINDNHLKKYTSPKNQIIKQLRQQYEILKNLSIEDNILKSDDKDKHNYQQNSSMSSSMHSKKKSKVKESDIRSVKINTKEIQALHIQKKQLEIVISNSMRKIQQLLNNEILLKKTIHELKNQIEGKGGISQEYEKKIKSMIKNQEQLHTELNKLKYQIEKNLVKNKELIEKIRTLQNEISSKDRQIKIGFDQQRKLHEMIKLQKDKYLHLEIQCKTYKMQYDLLEKQKNNEINRLKRQFSSFQGGNNKQMLFIVKRLQEELKQKDKKCSQLLLEINKSKIDQFPSPPQEKIFEKSYLQEILIKSNKVSQNNTKHIADNMSIILMKMAQIQKKNEQAMKKSRDQTKRKPSQYFEKPTNQNQTLWLEQKARDLQRLISNSQNEKKQLIAQVKKLKQLKFQVEDRNRILERKIKELQGQNENLQEQIRQLNHTNNQTTEHTSGHHQTLREQINVHLLKIKQVQSQKQAFIQALQRAKYEYSIKEKRFEDQIKSLKRYQDEIRGLQRSNDELKFQAEKIKKTGQFSLTMAKTQQQAEIKRILFENQSITEKLRISDSQLNRLKASSTRELTIKNEEIIILKKISEDLKIKSQADLSNQKIFYEQKITHITNTHIEQIKVFNEKLLNFSTSNQKLIAQMSHYSSMEGEVNELRRYLRQHRSLNQGIDHLWHVKQAQYNNVNEVLASIYY